MSSGAIPFTGSTEVLPDSDFMSTSLNEASKSSPASVSPDVHAESSDLIRSKKPLFLLLLFIIKAKISLERSLAALTSF